MIVGLREITVGRGGVKVGFGNGAELGSLVGAAVGVEVGVAAGSPVGEPEGCGDATSHVSE